MNKRVDLLLDIYTIKDGKIKEELKEIFSKNGDVRNIIDWMINKNILEPNGYKENKKGTKSVSYKVNRKNLFEELKKYDIFHKWDIIKENITKEKYKPITKKIFMTEMGINYPDICKEEKKKVIERFIKLESL